MQKTPFQNSSPFSTVLKCLSASQLRKTVKYEISGNCPLTWSLKTGWIFQDIWYFGMKSFRTLLGTLHNLKKNTQGFNNIHSWPKEMHHLEKIPNLHELQWNLSSFTKSKTRHTLGLFKILREPLDIFGWGFLRPVSNTCDQIWPVGGHLTLTVGHSGSQGIHGAFLLRLSVPFCMTSTTTNLYTDWSVRGEWTTTANITYCSRPKNVH